MNENAEIMDKLRDNGLSEEVNKRIADVYSRVHLGALKNSLTYSEVIDLFEGVEYDLEISERIYDELEKLGIKVTSDDISELDNIIEVLETQPEVIPNLPDSVSIDDPALLAEEKLAIILGTEGDGLSGQTIADCDYTVKIPMSHDVDSLNVAAASAVAFWELGKKNLT